MPACRADSFPGALRPFPVKIKGLPRAYRSFQLMELGFSSTEMNSPGRGQDIGITGLSSSYRVAWVVNSEYPGPVDTYLYLTCLFSVCFQPHKLGRL